MNNKLDKILPATLWLVIVTLGACFWFRARYGFNLFSGAHWHNLAQLQAAQMPVRTGFYISLVVFVIVAIFGLYRILRPRLRRIKFEKPGKNDKNVQKDRQMPEKTDVTIPAETASTLQIMPGNVERAPERPASPIVATESNAVRRPPRLHIPANTGVFAPTQTRTTTSTQSAFAPTKMPEIDSNTIRQIFESVGYVSKGTPRIKGMPTILFAIGTDEVLWIGATNVATAAMRRAIDTLQDVFHDTLEDIEININAFIINATDAATVDDTTILQFESTDRLREYMMQHPNAPIDETNRSEFDAYSAYISTVADYIVKV